MGLWYSTAILILYAVRRRETLITIEPTKWSSSTGLWGDWLLTRFIICSDEGQPFIYKHGDCELVFQYGVLGSVSCMPMRLSVCSGRGGGGEPLLT